MDSQPAYLCFGSNYFSYTGIVENNSMRLNRVYLWLTVHYWGIQSKLSSKMHLQLQLCCDDILVLLCNTDRWLYFHSLLLWSASTQLLLLLFILTLTCLASAILQRRRRRTFLKLMLFNNQVIMRQCLWQCLGKGMAGRLWNRYYIAHAN